MTRRSETPDFIEALARGLDVIVAFKAGEVELSLTVLASRTGLARPTARRIALTLEELGYMRATNVGYALTAKVLDLGLAYAASQGLWQLVRPHLTDLVQITNESCSIAQLDGSDIIYVARVAVPKIVGISVHIGTRFPAYATSLGKAILAFLTPEELSEALHSPSRAGVSASWQPSEEEILADLGQVRERGWALTDQQLALGIRSVAVPLRDAAGRVIASMNVNASAAETSVNDLVQRHLPALLEKQGAIQADIARFMSIPSQIA